MKRTREKERRRGREIDKNKKKKPVDSIIRKEPLWRWDYEDNVVRLSTVVVRFDLPSRTLGAEKSAVQLWVQ